MVRVDLIGRKVSRATGWLNDAEQLIGSDEDRFTREIKDRDLSTFYLFLAIQECIDLAAHWVSDEGWSSADDAAGSFEVLASRKVIDQDLADGMILAVGLRNRIAHGYASVDHQRLFRDALSGIPLLQRFLAAIATRAGVGT